MTPSTTGLLFLGVLGFGVQLGWGLLLFMFRRLVPLLMLIDVEWLRS